MKIIVGIAEMKLSARPDDVIVTHGLGSCLAVVVHDSAAGVTGMLHVMMPSSSANEQKAQANPCMFVDTGMQVFINALGKAGATKKNWTLTVAGGATVNGSDYFEIGKRNYVALKKYLWKSGLLISAEDIGGQSARTVYVDAGSGRVWLNKNGAESDVRPRRSQARANLQEDFARVAEHISC